MDPPTAAATPSINAEKQLKGLFVVEEDEVEDEVVFCCFVSC